MAPDDVSRSPQYFELLDAFRGEGCPLCQILTRGAGRFIDTYLYEYAMDRTGQKTFRKAGGFCAVHGAAVHDLRGYSASIATVYEQVLFEALDRLGSNTSLGGGLLRGRGSARDVLRAEQPCPACVSVATQTALLLDAMNVLLARSDFAAAFEASPGLCLPHARMALQHFTAASASLVRKVQRERWHALRHALDRFMALTGERDKGELGAAERDSWQRAVDLVSGLPLAFDYSASGR